MPVRVPRGGPPVQVGDLVGRAAAQLGAEQLAEHPVVPVGARPALQRYHEAVGALQLGQHPGGVLPPGQRVRQLTAYRLGDRRAQQHVLRLGRLPGEHLVDQVAGDARVLPAVPGDEAVRVRVRVQRAGREAQPRWPPLGTQVQVVDPPRARRYAVAGEQLGRLVAGECQVVCGQLGQPAFQPPPVQAERRLGARGGDQVQAAVRVPDQEVQPVRHRLVDRQVQVVQQQRHGPLQPGDRRGEPFQVGVLRNGDAAFGQRRADVRPEPGAVPRFDRVPGHRLVR
ncbi:hypothetical protein Pflav_034180 [Phytohabitans flavus]|uniref:Uncharacterized protein n=1 Tax=Phytohabitans flavus TaxID=1076124 RepID=A0A6F8XTD8_9ACTN|nr:hypothetical protein Pflav_034180 [Phytohabitans flavus]